MPRARPCQSQDGPTHAAQWPLVVHRLRPAGRRFATAPRRRQSLARLALGQPAGGPTSRAPALSTSRHRRGACDAGAIAAGDRPGLGNPDAAPGNSAPAVLRRLANCRHRASIGSAQLSEPGGGLPATRGGGRHSRVPGLALAEFSSN